MASTASRRRYHVFISHAGEDRRTMAQPMRDMLKERGVSAFVAENDIPPGENATEEMTFAMDNADIAVILLSPEFVAKKWPMKELLFFLHRRESARQKEESLPVIIPVFYRLRGNDLKNEPDPWHRTADGRSLYLITRFFERRDNGEPEADVEIIRRALKDLRGTMGVRNNRASNDDSALPARQNMLNDTCDVILRSMKEHNIPTIRNEGTISMSDGADRFRKHFHTATLRNIVLDFDKADENGKLTTQEGRIKRRILDCDRTADQVIAILGTGGVGKSTILKALGNDENIRERFCDGIHFVSLGMDATDGSLVEELSRVLYDSGAEKPAEKLQTETHLEFATREAIRLTLQWFHGRRCLFLIDDVWTGKLGVELFSNVVKLGSGGTESTVVFTTRELEIASNAPNQESIFRVRPRESVCEESRDILFSHVGIENANAGNTCSTSSIDEVLKICAGLPVSLPAAGKGVKMIQIDMAPHDGDAWTEYLTTICDYHERLLKENVDDYGNLYITFGASILLLERRGLEKLGFKTRASIPEMHRRLCVLLKQDKVPASMLKHLWELRNDEEAKHVGRLFVEVGMAETAYVVKQTSRVWQLSIHDSIHDYAIAEARRHEDVVRAREVLLDGYSHPDSGGPVEKWLFVENDGYILENLERLLGEANRDEELGDLLYQEEIGLGPRQCWLGPRR